MVILLYVLAVVIVSCLCHAAGWQYGYVSDPDRDAFAGLVEASRADFDTVLHHAVVDMTSRVIAEQILSARLESLRALQAVEDRER